MRKKLKTKKTKNKERLLRALILGRRGQVLNSHSPPFDPWEDAFWAEIRAEKAEAAARATAQTKI